MLRVSLMYAFKRACGLTYKMATFIAAKGLFNMVYRVETNNRFQLAKVQNPFKYLS